MVNGYTFKSTKYSNQGYSIIRIANVQKGIIEDEDKVYYPEEYKSEFAESILKEGDILMSLTGNVGRVGVIYEQHLPAALNQRVQGLRIKDSSQINHQYLFSLLNLDDFETLCIKNASGSAQLNLSTVWLRNCKIVCPPIQEQEHFAKIAKQADKSKFVGFKSQFIEMFGDPIAWQNDKSLPVLSDTVNIVSGFPFDAELFNADGNGAVLIRIRDIQRGYSETYTTESFDEQYRIKKSELLIGMDGMFEIARWQSEDAALNQRVCCLRMKGGENDTFIQYLVQPILKHIEVGTNATTVKHLSVKQINAIRIPIASDAQKNEFALIVEQADKSKYVS